MDEAERSRKALSTIHDEAAKLLRHEMSPEVREGVNLIISIARYGFDPRGTPDQMEESTDS
jgi:hypothetical protein